MSYNTAFFAIISILLFLPLLSLISSLRGHLTVKAGKVSNFYLKYKLASCKVPEVIRCGNETVVLSGLKHLYVHGNSMKDYNISDGQYVFVESFRTIDEKRTIQTHPVLVFNITKSNIQSKYKLRKFVTYTKIVDTDWNEVYANNRERIKISREAFVKECVNKVQKLKDKNSLYILSETFDENLRKYSYSFHPIESLYARVRYACNLS